jgi:hypothetical protein
VVPGPEAWFLIPTARTELTGFGTRLPVRFVRKPDKFDFQTKFSSASGWNRYAEPVRQVPGCLKNRIRGEFDVFSNLH